MTTENYIDITEGKGLVRAYQSVTPNPGLARQAPFLLYRQELVSAFTQTEGSALLKPVIQDLVEQTGREVIVCTPSPTTGGYDVHDLATNYLSIAKYVSHMNQTPVVPIGISANVVPGLMAFMSDTEQIFSTFIGISSSNHGLLQILSSSAGEFGAFIKDRIRSANSRTEEALGSMDDNTEEGKIERNRILDLLLPALFNEETLNTLDPKVLLPFSRVPARYIFSLLTELNDRRLKNSNRPGLMIYGEDAPFKVLGKIREFKANWGETCKVHMLPHSSYYDMFVNADLRKNMVDLICKHLIEYKIA